MADELPRLDRIFQSARVGIDRDHRPAPVRIADGLWSLERHLKMPGRVTLPSRTTIVRVDGGGLALISPPPARDETFAAIDVLGRVDALIAPNSFHYLFVNAAMERYPNAKLYLAPGLQRRVATLPAGTDLGDRSPSADLDTVVLGPVRGWSEVLLFHRPSRTLIISDAAFNIRNVEGLFERIFWRGFGVPNGFGPSRTARLTLLSNRGIAGKALRRAREWPFERILVAHGEVVQTEARAQFERAYRKYLEAD